MGRRYGRRDAGGEVRQQHARALLVWRCAISDVSEEAQQLVRLVEGEHGEQFGRRVFGGGVVDQRVSPPSGKPLLPVTAEAA